MGLNMIMQKNEKQKGLWSRGFSLVELMIVIAVMSVLISLAAWSFLGIRGRIRKTSCHENMRTILHAANLAVTERSDLDGKNLTVRTLMDARFLRTKPVCPAGGKYWINGESDNLRVTCTETNDGDDHGFVE